MSRLWLKDGYRGGAWADTVCRGSSYRRAMADESPMAQRSDEQQEFCAKWLEARGVFDRPTLDQLMEMAEAYAAHRLRNRRSVSAAP